MSVPKDQMTGIAPTGEIVVRGEVYKLVGFGDGEVQVQDRNDCPVLIFEPRGLDTYRGYTGYGAAFDLVKEGPNMVMYEGPNRTRSLIGPVGAPFAIVTAAQRYLMKAAGEQGEAA